MKLSIIIPSYKETRHQLLETLFSIDVQKRVDFNKIEVVVVNDCGDPLCPNNTITDFSCLQNIMVKYLHNTKNGGPLSAREYGFKHSCGEYVQFIDAEDSLINSFYLASVLEFIEQKQPDIILSPNIWEYLLNGQLQLKTQEAKFLNFHGKVIRRQVIEDHIVWLDEKILYAEDEYFMRQLFDHIYPHQTIVIQSPQYYYKYNPNSLTNNGETDSFGFYSIIYPTYLHMMGKYIETKNQTERQRKATFFFLRIVLDIEGGVFRFHPENDIQNAQAIKSFITKWKQYFLLDEEFITNILNNELLDYKTI